MVLAQTYVNNTCSKTFFTACREWLSGEFSQLNCLQLYDKTRTACGCMRYLANPNLPGILDAVAEYMIHWASLSCDTKYEVLDEWMKIADFIGLTSPIPRAEIEFTDFQRLDL